MSLDAFMDELLEGTTPFNDLPRHKNERWWNDTVHLEVLANRYAEYDTAHIAFIGTYYPNRGQGHAKQCFLWLFDLATKHGVTLTGKCSPVGTTGLKKRELNRRYRSLGWSFDRNSNGVWEPEKQEVV